MGIIKTSISPQYKYKYKKDIFLLVVYISIAVAEASQVQITVLLKGIFLTCSLACNGGPLHLVTHDGVLSDALGRRVILQIFRRLL